MNRLGFEGPGGPGLSVLLYPNVTLGSLTDADLQDLLEQAIRQRRKLNQALSSGDRVAWTQGWRYGEGVITRRIEEPNEPLRYHVRIFLRGHDTGRSAVVQEGELTPVAAWGHTVESGGRTPGRRRARDRAPEG